MPIAAPDTERERLIRLAKAQRALRIKEERQLYEGSLYEFARAAWPTIDSSQFQDNWAMQALCAHLEAVTRGEIRRLLINFPPRCGKSLVSSIAWLPWVWAQPESTFLSGPQVRFMCGSYNHELSLRHANSTRQLLLSPFYQKYWGHKFQLRKDQNTKTQFDNTRGGSRFSTSVGGTLVGVGGDVLLVDDPHNTEAVESEAERETVMRWWRELSSTRMNDPKQSAIVVIMQRLHQKDVSGAILSSMTSDWEHLMIPMAYEWERHCVTRIGWEDPRGLDADGAPLVYVDNGVRRAVSNKALRILENEREGMLMWPDRFGPKEVKEIEGSLGPYMASGRLQQRPSPAGGNIFRETWWKMYETDPETRRPRHPPFHIIASLDPAYTEKQENDPSGFTVWGLFKEDRHGPTKIVLLFAWRKRLDIHGQMVERKVGETNSSYVGRSRPEWGLVEQVAHDCKRLKVDTLLIEAKATGLTVAQEIRRLYKDESFGVQLINPGSQDKVARAYSVQHLFADGLVYAPDRDWAQMVIDEMTEFPKAEHDDLCDSATQALRFLRDNRMALRHEEQAREEREAARYQRPAAPLYEV